MGNSKCGVLFSTRRQWWLPRSTLPSGGRPPPDSNYINLQSIVNSSIWIAEGVVDKFCSNFEPESIRKINGRGDHNGRCGVPRYQGYGDDGGDAFIFSSASPLQCSAVISIPCICHCSIPQGHHHLKLRYKEKRWDPKKIIGSGGMPSSHSSTVVALAVSIGLHEGVEASTFAIAVVLAFIVMYDASGVRLHAGRQAELLNQIVCEFPPEHPLSTSIPLRDSLGHTPLQVVAGAMLGCIVAFVIKVSD